MKFVELKDDVGEPTLVNLDRVNEFRKDDINGKASVFYESDSSSLGMTVAEVKAAIRDQAGPGGLAGTCSAEAPGAVRRDGDTVTITFGCDPDPCTDPCPGLPPSPEPEPGGPIPLAVGQVWAGKDGEYRQISGLYRDLGERVQHLPAGHGGIIRDQPADDFHIQHPTLISPAPEPAPPEAPPDPVALLAGGKRLRYVRDAGPIKSGLRFGSEAFVALFDRLSAGSPGFEHKNIEDAVWFGAAASFKGFDLYNADVAGQPWHLKESAADHIVALLSDLGYRFAGLAGEGA